MKNLLKAVVRKTSDAGYLRTSIWSFNKPAASHYTSVTRGSFLGIGAGASSRMGDYFTLNTFSVPEYVKAVENGSPLALATRLDTADKIALCSSGVAMIWLLASMTSGLLLAETCPSVSVVSCPYSSSRVWLIVRKTSSI